MSDSGNKIESAATRGLSEEDVDDFREAFNNFDQDKNGSIDSKELATVLRSLGYTPTPVQLKKVMDKVRVLSTACKETLYLSVILCFSGLID